MFSISSPLISMRSSIFRQSNRLFSQYAKNEQIFLHSIEGTTIASLSKDPKATSLGTVTGSTAAIVPTNFKTNPTFVSILHETVSKTIQNDFSFIVEAGANANTYMPIYDFRHTPNYGRIPEVDNIFGYVQVDAEGKIVPGTYESNNLYRLCNGESGIIKLSDFLYSEVQKACENSS
ncbi:hypothetical protein CAAN1_06S01728 [[Candida] anglica]|uniref:Uncharacterized protein n=1 Tax=[Candida] anglica TaxID=148631 RepID=A0ABP0ELK6_9ASCO